MRVAFRVDASDRIGGGHVMRCLALADELKCRGAETSFISALVPESLAERVTSAGHRLERVPAPPDLDRAGDDWHEPPLPDELQQADAIATLDAIGAAPDWLAVDHYLLDSRWHSAARRRARRILVIDELANRRLDCDLLVDQTLGRTPVDHTDLVPPNATILAGACYALLRPEFADERAAALERRRQARPVRRILISLGATDTGGVTAQALEAVLQVAPECAVDVVLGTSAPSLGRVRELASANSNVNLHLESREMALLMRDADFAIGAAGSTSWERCCLGLPSATVVLAGNQQAIAQALDQAGAAVAVEPSQLGALLSELLRDQQRLLAMSAAAFAVTDGRGTRRVAERVCEGPFSAPRSISLRNATAEDADLVWFWRNDVVTRRWSRSSEPLLWPEHEAWFRSALADPDRHLLIGEWRGAPVGVVRFDRLHDERASYEVSINVRPDVRGAGIGKALLAQACSRFIANKCAARFRAWVQESNWTSIRLFEGIGFRESSLEVTGTYRRLHLDADRESLNEWWMQPRAISICVDTPGWFDPFAAELAEKISAGGDRVSLVRNPMEVQSGGIAFYLSCMKLTPLKVLQRNRQNIVVHASALPEGRGFSPLVWQILEGRNRIPLTMIEAAEEADSGAVLMQDELEFDGHELNVETRTALGKKIVEMCLRYLEAPAPPIGAPQQGTPSWYRRRRAEDSRLDPHKTIAEQFELLRVVDNERYPAFFDYRGHRYILRVERVRSDDERDEQSNAGGG